MSIEPEDNSIDRLFRTSIDNMETEPSDRFWNRAYDGILKNESKAYERKIKVWRGVSVILAVAVACLIGYNVYTNNKVTDIEKQVAGIERKQLQTANNEPDASNTLANSLSSSNANTHSQLPKAAEVRNNVVSANRNALVVANNQYTASRRSNNVVLAANDQPVVNTNAALPTVSEIGSTSKGSEQIATADNNNIVTSQEQQSSDPVVTNDNNEKNVITQENEPKTAINNLIYLDERVPSEPITIPPQDTAGDEIVAMDVQDNTTVQPIGGKSSSDAWVAKKKLNVLHKLSVSAFLAPSMYEPIMHDNGTNTGVSAKDIKAREQQQLAYTFGTNIGYDILPKLTIQTGVSYRAYRFHIDPTQVYAKRGDFSGATYPVVTSSGTVNIPYISGYAPWGYDTVATAKGSATRSYISIPLNLKYIIYDKPKFDMFIAAGGAVSLLANNYVTIHCQNQWGEEDVYVYDINGTNKVNFSYKLGIGAEFTLGRKFTLYAEPSYTGAITPTAKGTPITTYSNYFDFAAGVGYHF